MDGDRFEITFREKRGSAFAITARYKGKDIAGVFNEPADLGAFLRGPTVAAVDHGADRALVLDPNPSAVRDPEPVKWPPALPIAREWGALLYDDLFAGEIGAVYRAALEEARSNRRSVRLTLRFQQADVFQQADLAAIPWELLYDKEEEGTGKFVAINTISPLVRYLSYNRADGTVEVQGPLRILGLIASPRDLVSLDVEMERSRVERALQGAQEGRIQIEWVKHATWRELEQRVGEYKPHILHFIGHGGADKDGEAAIVLESDDGSALPLQAGDLADLIHNCAELKFVFLNSCDGGRGAGDNLFSSAAATLVRRGIPAVLAMQHKISDTAAVAFARGLYESLAKFEPLDVAVSKARRATKIDEDSMEWATPVLFTHADNLQLFGKDPGPHQPPVLPKPDWRVSELPVRVIVSVKNPETLRRVRAVQSQFDKAAAAFGSSQRLRFVVDEQSPEGLLVALGAFSKDTDLNSPQMVLVISDDLVDPATDGKRRTQPSQTTTAIRALFLNSSKYCGLLGLVEGTANRTTDVDRELSTAQIPGTPLYDLAVRVSQGLRLKAPPGKARSLQAAESVIVRLVQSESDFFKCLQLRYEVYGRMGYLEESILDCLAQVEIDCYDSGALHFVAELVNSAAPNARQVIGTLRLVPKNPFENIPRGTIIGPSPQTVVTAQKQMLNRLIEQLASEKESNRVLSARLHKRGMCSLPILQSNDLEQKATDLLNAYPLIAEVSRVVVHPGYRGLGVSTLLLRAATAVALELNLDLLLLECIPSHMQMYHDKYGFELIEGGAHGRAQQLDQFAVAMKLDLKNTGSSEYLDLPKRGLAAIHAHGNDPAGLFKSKYFCLCRESDCWQKGAYGAWLKQACPLYSLHTSKSVKQVAKQS